MTVRKRTTFRTASDKKENVDMRFEMVHLFFNFYLEAS